MPCGEHRAFIQHCFQRLDRNAPAGHDRQKYQITIIVVSPQILNDPDELDPARVHIPHDGANAAAHPQQGGKLVLAQPQHGWPDMLKKPLQISQIARIVACYDQQSGDSGKRPWPAGNNLGQGQHVVKSIAIDIAGRKIKLC